jgi:hypothetical protein
MLILKRAFDILHYSVLLINLDIQFLILIF